MPQTMASDLGLHFLPMSHKKDTRLIWVEVSIMAGTDDRREEGRGGIRLDFAYEIFSFIWFIQESDKHENVINLKLGDTLWVYCFCSNYHQPLKLDEAAFYEPYEGPLFTVAEHQSMSSGTRHFHKQIFSNKGRY